MKENNVGFSFIFLAVNYGYTRKDHVPSREITRGAVNRLEATIYVAQGEVKDFPRYLETALHFDIKYIYLIRRVQVNDK